MGWIFLLMVMWFVQQPICISILNAGQTAHELNGTWDGSVVGTYTLLRMVSNLTIPCLIIVLLIYMVLRTQRKTWSGYEDAR
jgi:hypothetical protein